MKRVWVDFHFSGSVDCLLNHPLGRVALWFRAEWWLFLFSLWKERHPEMLPTIQFLSVSRWADRWFGDVASQLVFDRYQLVQNCKGSKHSPTWLLLLSLLSPPATISCQSGHRPHNFSSINETAKFSGWRHLGDDATSFRGDATFVLCEFSLSFSAQWQTRQL